MRLLDLFSGAGGCAVGYHRAGFTEIVGVDHRPQPRYPFAFVQADAMVDLRMLVGGWSIGPDTNGQRWWLKDFDAIHASPPCQRYTRAAFRQINRDRHPDLLGPTRTLLLATGRPWVMENVPGAPVQDHPIELCGLMFGLKLFRHRWFESSAMLFTPQHPSHRGIRIGENGMRCLIGNGGWPSQRQRDRIRFNASSERDTKASWEAASGIDWMTRYELAQAIPPAYTAFVGRQLLDAIRYKSGA